MLQYIIVGIVIAASAAYMCWRTWQSLTGRRDPCADCDGCALKDAKQRAACEKNIASRQTNKKMRQKFGDKK